MSEFPLVRQAQRDLSLGRLDLAVYDILRDRLEFVEFRAVKLAELESALARSRPQVVGSLKTLVERGYIERGPKAYTRGPNTYRLKYSQRPSPAPGSERAGGYGMVSKGVEW